MMKKVNAKKVKCYKCGRKNLVQYASDPKGPGYAYSVFSQRNSYRGKLYQCPYCNFEFILEEE